MNYTLCFYQWDINKRIEITDSNIMEVHFSNAHTDKALVCAVYEEDGKRWVNVPNILLQEQWSINAYACCNDCVIQSAIYGVISRAKPDDYVYTETEIKCYDDLVKRIEALEKNGTGSGNNDGNTYELPTASETIKGGIMVGDGLQMDGEVLEVIPEGEFEHIETITLTEATTEIVLTEEPDGTPYAFKAAAVKMLVSDKSDNAYKVQTRFYGANNEPHLITLYHADGIGKAAERRWTAFAIPMYGRMFGYMTTPVSTYDSIPGFGHPSYSYFFGEYAPIGTIRVQSPSGAYPKGTRIEIYGVRT